MMSNKILNRRASALKFFIYSTPSIKQINAILSVKSKDQWLMKLFVRTFPAIGVVLSPVSVKSTLIVIKQIYRLRSNMNLVGLVKYLKVCSVCLQQCIGGHVVPDVGLLGMRISRTDSGIPRIIPVYHRELIRQGNKPIIRLYLTLFALYRVINIPAKVKIKSITDPFSGENAHLIDGDISNFVKLFCKPAFKNVSFREKLSSFSKIFVIWKASAGSGNFLSANPFATHPITLVKCALAMHRKYNLEYHLRYWLTYTNNVVALWIFDCALKCVNMYSTEVSPKLLAVYENLKVSAKSIGKMPIGRLAFLHEPAGKMRVVALVDPYTQWALYPLHKTVLSIVRRYKMDGTFNQVKPLSHVTDSAALYSLDLSSATDRLPISLQKDLLLALTGDAQLVNSWASLLVDRPYWHPSQYPLPSKEVKYSVGQPMGALSSWAMLALTHHFIVQSAAWRSGIVPLNKLYTNYALLGDDLVLGDKSVMKQYLHILRALGVECGLHKSVLSHDGLSLEFAKKTFYRGEDVSPVSLTELVAACSSISEIISFGRKYNLTLAKIAKTLGMGWRTVSSVNKPIGKLNVILRGISIALIMPVTPEGVTELFSLGKPLQKDHYDALAQFVKIEYAALSADLKKLRIEIGKKVRRDWLGNPLAGSITSDVSPLSGKVTVRDYSNVFGIPFGTLRTVLGEIQDKICLPIVYASIKACDTWAGRVRLERYSNLPRVFLDYLEIINGIVNINSDGASLSMKRQETVRGRSPQLVRIWNRWSAIFQGTKVDVSSVNQSFRVNTKIVISAGSAKPSRVQRTINFRKANKSGIQSKS